MIRVARAIIIIVPKRLEAVMLGHVVTIDRQEYEFIEIHDVVAFSVDSGDRARQTLACHVGVHDLVRRKQKVPIRIDRAQQPLLREQDFFPAENAGERHPRITRERGREVTAVNDLCAFVGGAVIDDREVQPIGDEMHRQFAR